jgi:zinc protease
MKYLILAALFVLLFSQSSSGESRKIFPYKMHVKDLPNGLKMIAVPFDSPGIIAYYTIVRAGSRNEVEPGLSGFAHFFEHMMFRGTPKYPSEKYNDILKELGVDSNAFTTDDWTCYHTTAPASALETMMELESDRFQNLKYSLEDFQKEAKAVLGEYNKSASSPFLKLFESERDAAFSSHTYKHTTIGFLKDILDMPNQYDYSLKFFDRFYRPENCILLVVGDVNPDRFFTMAEKYYGGWKRGSHKADIPQEPQQKEEKVINVDWKGTTLPYMLIGYHIPAFSTQDKDKAALDLLSQLTFSTNSPLYQKLVLEQQRVDVLAGGGEDNRDPSLFDILVRVKDEKDVAAVRDEIFAKLEELKTRKISESELADVKSNFRYSFAMGLNTPDNVAVVLAKYLNLTADPEAVNKVYDLYDRVTPDDIQRVAQKYFAKENRTVVTLKGAAN